MLDFNGIGKITTKIEKIMNNRNNSIKQKNINFANPARVWPITHIKYQATLVIFLTIFLLKEINDDMDRRSSHLTK